MEYYCAANTGLSELIQKAAYSIKVGLLLTRNAFVSKNDGWTLHESEVLARFTYEINSSAKS